MKKKHAPYCAWLVRAGQMQQIENTAKRLNIRKAVFIRLFIKYILFFTDANFIAEANEGKLNGEYTLPAPKMAAWLQPPT